MNVAWVNTKQYFRDSVSTVLPQKNLLLYPSLVEQTIDVLSCFIPEKKTYLLPVKLQRELRDELLEVRAYKEILRIVSNKKVLDMEEIRMVQFLEQEAIRYAGFLLETWRGNTSDGKYDKEEFLLSNLRRATCKGVRNTCCYHCGKVLCRNGGMKQNPHYCVRNENKACYDERTSWEKQRVKEWEYVNRVCKNCDKPLTLSLDMNSNHYHAGEFYCNDKCYQTYRKRALRKYLN